jgi:[calcium/calmodulin-dependent protein kinase] kinase
MWYVPFSLQSDLLPNLAQMKAARKFKHLISRKRPQFVDTAFGESNVFSEPPEDIDSPLARSHSDNLSDRKPVEGNLVSHGITRDIQINDKLESIHEVDGKDKIKKLETERISPNPLTLPSDTQKPSSPQHGNENSPSGVMSTRSDTGRGQAHDPLEDTLFLSIGVSSSSPEPEPGSAPVVCESPSATDMNVYENAYEEEIERILRAEIQGRRPTIYLTKRVEDVPRLKNHEDITDFSRAVSSPKLGFTALADLAKSHVEAHRKKQDETSTPKDAAGKE